MGFKFYLSNMEIHSRNNGWLLVDGFIMVLMVPEIDL